MSASHTSEWTVYAAPLHAIVQAVESFGGQKEGLLREAGIEPQWLEQPDYRFPVQHLFRLYELAVERTGNQDLALYVGRISYINGLNLQLYMSTICNTFREYLNLMPSVLKFTGDIGEVKIRRADELICLEWLPLEPESQRTRYLTDTFLTMSCAIVDSLCVQPIKALRADFSYTEPQDTVLLRKIFGEHLRFNQPVSCLYYERDCLTYPITHLDHKLDAGQTDPLLRLFEEETERDPFLGSMRQSIIRLLPQGDMSIDKVAGELNVSRRTLQRRLSDRETQFLQILQDVREELALRYLTDERLGITEIAFLLGYADQGSFSSAFKAWQGLSPRDYRRRP